MPAKCSAAVSGLSWGRDTPTGEGKMPALCALQQQAGYVVVLRSVSHESIQFLKQAA